jgi:hypothetical protein
MLEKNCVAGRMFHNFLVNRNPSSFPLSPLTPRPIPSKLCDLKLTYLPARILMFFFPLVILKYALTDLQEQCPYSCNVCNKTFTEQNDLKTHQCIHSGHRPFSCDVCKKSFSQQGHLKGYLRIHSGERPFSCNLCNRTRLD